MEHGGDVPWPLSAKYKGSFAYDTIKDRLPTILTKTIDTVHRMHTTIKQEYGSTAEEELKDVIGGMSKLRNELQTDKPIVPMENLPLGNDTSIWNNYLEKTKALYGSEPSWFKSAWLYVECYMYRRIYQSFLSSTLLREIDPFREQKDQGFFSSVKAIDGLLSYLQSTLKKIGETDKDQLKVLFEQFTEVDLWGNKCDLSISAGADNFQTISPLAQLDNYRPFVLVDNMDDMWEHLQTANAESPESVRLDIIVDNAGFELITDLVFAEFVISTKLVKTVVFHPKDIPWFVSDVTVRDIRWTLDQLFDSESPSMAHFGSIWKGRLITGQWQIHTHPFWTLPHDYSEMQSVAPNLYAELGKSNLAIFKGDLNYRKLVSDRQWVTTTKFDEALRGFCPTALCSLRTLKADVVVGLKDGQAKKAEKENSQWMVSGEYAVIQFSNIKSKFT